MKAGLMTATKGAFPGGTVVMEEDAAAEREVTPLQEKVNGKFTISKLDAVYRAGNATRDDIPSHLLPKESVPEAVGKFYESLCPAGVYEWNGTELVVNAPNCVDCKATDVVGPRWRPREGGSGPSYKRM
jgi:ferredoxin-like protein FixX